MGGISITELHVARTVSQINDHVHLGVQWNSGNFGEWKVFTLTVPLRSGRVEFLRCGDGIKTHESTLAVWTIFGLSISALSDFLDFLGFSPD